MRRALSVILGSFILAGLSGQASAAREAPETQLARALEGRVAGKPVDCINLRDIRSSRIIDRTAILYETSGGAIYLNRPTSGRSSLDQWDVLMTNTHSSRLCSIDVVHLLDQSSHMLSGVVFLGEFVPYRRVARSQAD